jgi:hypothetical protein
MSDCPICNGTGVTSHSEFRKDGSAEWVTEPCHVCDVNLRVRAEKAEAEVARLQGKIKSAHDLVSIAEEDLEVYALLAGHLAGHAPSVLIDIKEARKVLED